MSLGCVMLFAFIGSCIPDFFCYTVGW